MQFVEAHAVTPKHNTDNPEEVNPILGLSHLKTNR